jgi:FkbM family methyltransferase
MSTAQALHAAAEVFRNAPGLWRVAPFLRELRDRIAPVSTTRKMRDGFTLALRPREDAYERHMFFHGTYEPATLALFDKLIKPGDSVIDVGANIGLMTMKAATLVGSTGHVIAFEPNPEVFRRLEGNVELNRLTCVSLRRCALGSSPGELTLYDRPEANIGSASLVPTDAGQSVGKVEIRRLDDSIGDIAPSLIKIDVEGFEGEVIAGAMDTLRRFRPAIVMEFDRHMPSPDEDPFGAFDRVMNSGVYRCFRFTHSKYSTNPSLTPIVSRDDLPEADNIVFLDKGARTFTSVGE